jgi:hypothetical protein
MAYRRASLGYNELLADRFPGASEDGMVLPTAVIGGSLEVLSAPKRSMPDSPPGPESLPLSLAIDESEA